MSEALPSSSQSDGQAVPQGWTAVTEADGGVRILRPRRSIGKALEDVAIGLVLAVVVLGFALYRAVPGMLERGDRLGLALVAVVVTVVLGGVLGSSFLGVLTAEEWRVSAGLLEIRRRTLGFSWNRPYESACLAIEKVEAGHILNERLVLRTGGKKEGLTEFQGPAGSAEARELGELLSRITGFRLSA